MGVHRKLIRRSRGEAENEASKKLSASKNFFCFYFIILRPPLPGADFKFWVTQKFYINECYLHISQHNDGMNELFTKNRTEFQETKYLNNGFLLHKNYFKKQESLGTLRSQSFCSEWWARGRKSTITRKFLPASSFLLASLTAWLVSLRKTWIRIFFPGHLRSQLEFLSIF